MNCIKIQDLSKDTTLDQAATRGIRGGISKISAASTAGISGGGRLEAYDAFDPLEPEQPTAGISSQINDLAATESRADISSAGHGRSPL